MNKHAKLVLIICSLNLWFNNTLASNHSTHTTQDNVIALIQQAENDIKNKGKEKIILYFRQKSSHIFAISYDGTVLASPIHPETVGTNQLYFKDASGLYAVQEEINLAKVGGGCLKGRLRINPNTGKYACRKLYIRPMSGDYFIGSWYYYPAKKHVCVV